MFRAIRGGLRQFRDDLRHARHLDAYLIIGLALVLLALDALNIADPGVYLPIITAVLIVLLLKTIHPPQPTADLDAVLRDRDDYGSLAEFIGQGQVVWIYGPSAISIARQESLLRDLLRRGAEIRVLMQNPNEGAAMRYLSAQLDEHNDLPHDIEQAQYHLDRVKVAGNLQVRFLAASPGFSMVIVDPHRADGVLTVETHGYHAALNKRMHLLIAQRDSMEWFRYWVAQYEQMWADGVDAT